VTELVLLGQVLELARARPHGRGDTRLLGLAAKTAR
jgi:hypothetical protein